MNLLGAFIFVVLVVVVFGASRRWAMFGMMAGVLFLTEAQQVQVAGFNLYAVRLLGLVGFIRVLARGEFSFRDLNKLDRVFLWLYGYSTFVFLLRANEGVTNQIGMAVDAFLCYFSFRGLVPRMDEYMGFLRTFCLLLAPYTLLVVSESISGHNPFTILGGIEGGSTWMRHGRPRCFGSFRQPDTLGMFAASFLPLFISLVCIKRERRLALLGIGLCLILVLAANSGGAVSAAGMGLLGWGFWLYRTKMRLVRRGIVALLALLALVMQAPVWYIFARASSITGGDGWHRSKLIDAAWQHLGQWWLAGIPIKDTSGWMPYELSTTGAADITNQYLVFGIAAGLGAVFLFIRLLILAFSSLGTALASVRSVTANTRQNEFLLWGLAVMLVIHIINWFGISYFDQMYVVYCMQLALISTLSAEVLRVREEAPGRALEEICSPETGSTIAAKSFYD